MKRIAIYGSTGSIGTQTLDVVREHPDKFKVSILSAHNNADLLIRQCKEFKPEYAVITNTEKYPFVQDALRDESIEVHSGQKALDDMAGSDNYDLLMAAIVGFAGLTSTYEAVKKGKTVALANKETLVVGGQLVMNAVQKNKADLIPVDSEHSAIFQSLVGEKYEDISKIILTASGGPFLGKKPNFLINVKKDHALQHPNWTMGSKITIDSSSLMNKGLEMIEAKWLFGLKNEQIEVLVHPQSIIHSIVEFIDGSQKAQLGLPDMKLPIQYAMAYPKRIQNTYPRLDLARVQQLRFERPDSKTFRNLAIAHEAMVKEGNAPCIMNAANEIAVDAFLKNKVGFLEMSDLIEKCLKKIHYIEHPSLKDLMETDKETRNYCLNLIRK